MQNLFPPLAWPQGPDRLPRQDPASYTPQQAAAAAALIASPRGEVRGPFVPLMRSPELMDLTQQLGAFLRYRCSVPERLREWAICLIARLWGQPYEWHAHARLAHQAGVARATLAVLLAGEETPPMTEDEAVIWRFITQLHAERFVSDAIWAETVALLSETGAVELSALCGYYTLLAMVLNVARVPVPGVAFALPGEAEQPLTS
ncbi:carboxymuconolactone decarboxylase family protein [Novosphingobium rosa]|uniref:carboxymuconolactone decarboxylase family protein n=1 Tax=Novosphingobium rosa TaxID=76978 RepID=UPI000836F460|nr:carboxymuconolactone decarboxylase family protein [Novosphingobium rosa]